MPSHRRKSGRSILSLLSTAVFAGCAAPRAPSPSTMPSSAINAPVSVVDPKAPLALNEITPVPRLQPAPPGASQGEAPLDALMLYARARVDELNGRRPEAVSQLEQAARLDPYSFAIQNDLARLYLTNNSAGDQAESALEHAARLKSDDLQTQTDLGRVYLSRGELDKATEHLRLATETTEYRNYADESAITDYYLAQSLQKQGYDRAALDSYLQLLKRLQNAPDSVRGNNEIEYWLSRPDLLYAEVGRLREKQGDPAAALTAYHVVADRNPDDLDTRARMIPLLLKLNRREDAARLAIESIVHTHANRQSLDMLRDVYRGDDDKAVAALNQLADQHPQDRTVLFALTDMLVADGKPEQARTMLVKSSAATTDDKGAGDTQVVGKLFRLLADEGQTDKSKMLDAARLLIETSARRPDSANELLPYWIELISQTRPNRLHPSQVQAISVDAGSVAARAYWVARIAIGRPELIKSSLAESVAQRPPFRPAYRFAISQILADGTLTPASRDVKIKDLVASVSSTDPALSQELLGIGLLNSASGAAHSADNAAATELAGAATGAFESAEKLGDLGPDLRSELAQAQLLKPDTAGYERTMWKLLGDRPDNDAAYTELFHFYQDNNQAERAVAVSQSWLLADPNNIGAQLLHVLLLLRAGVKEEASKAITDLYHAHPADPQVVDVLQQVLQTQDGKNGSDAFEAMMEARVAHVPGDLIAVTQLVNRYVARKRMSEADHVIDNARAAVAHDADQLYYVAHLYDSTAIPGNRAVGDSLKDSPVERTLQMALKVDPDNAGASNDLGYEWADAGEHLADAESLIRRAIELEPDNGAYLDSLGWVLYKQGQFNESRGYLEKAVEPASEADPIVLDHLGDDLYRLNRNADAKLRWQDSLAKVEDRIRIRLQEAAATGAGTVPSAGDELGPLQLHLQQKLKQVEQGSPVNVAPVVAGTNERQARSGL